MAASGAKRRKELGNSGARIGCIRLLQMFLNDLTRLAEIHSAGVARLELRHAFAHIAEPLRARRLDRLGASRAQFVLAELLRQEFLDDDDFLPLFLGQVEAVALLILPGGL